MFPLWRLKLREARVAWQSGRIDEAGAMLADRSLREFLPAKELAQDVAGKIVQRAGDRFARGDSLAGWQDLAVAVGRRMVCTGTPLYKLACVAGSIVPIAGSVG